MLLSPIPTKTRKRIKSLALLSQRRQRGSQIAEFGAALTLLTAVVIIPVIDFSIVPVRWMMAQETIKTYTRQLAFCESFSQATQKLLQEPSLESKLNSLGGVKTNGINLRLRIASIYHPSEVLFVESAGGIPKDWLPDAQKGPFTYTIILEVKTLLSPAFPVPVKRNPLPGVTGPFPILATGSHGWENLGRNPNTGNFYINE